MMRAFVVAAAAVFATAFAMPASAAPLTWRIAGTGAGVLDGQAFDGRFTFILKGDTANHTEGFGLSVVDPLDEAKVRIAGLGTATFELATRLGYNDREGAVFFSRSGGSDNNDLFDFRVDAPVDLTRAFGPIVGRDVFGLNQFVQAPTSLGLLDFDRSSDVQFSAVPLPASAPLLLVALAGAGMILQVRRKTA